MCQILLCCMFLVPESSGGQLAAGETSQFEQRYSVEVELPKSQHVMKWPLADLCKYHVLFHAQKVEDLHRGPKRCWSTKLYLRARNSKSEKCRMGKVFLHSTADLPDSWRSSWSCWILPSSIQSGRWAAGMASRNFDRKIRWEEKL